MTSQTFTFDNQASGSPAGETGDPLSRTVAIVDDSLVEPTETILLSASLGSPTAGFDVNTRATLLVDSGTISIQDNDGKPLLILCTIT